jgi:hypothetical protein
MVVLWGGAVSDGRGTPVGPQEEAMVEQDLAGGANHSARSDSCSSLLLTSLELSDTHSPYALNTSPPQNRTEPLPCNREIHVRTVS